MAEVTEMVRGQLLPLFVMRLVLPNTCIAEIINFSELEPVENPQPWVLGTMAWRSLRIPVLSFEAANGMPFPDKARKPRVAVLNGIHGHAQLSFYAIALQGIPRLISLDKTNLNTITAPDVNFPLAYEQAMIGTQSVVIPDLEKFEQQIVDHGYKTGSLTGAVALSG